MSITASLEATASMFTIIPPANDLLHHYPQKHLHLQHHKINSINSHAPETKAQAQTLKDQETQQQQHHHHLQQVRAQAQAQAHPLAQASLPSKPSTAPPHTSSPPLPSSFSSSTTDSSSASSSHRVSPEHPPLSRPVFTHHSSFSSLPHHFSPPSQQTEPPQLHSQTSRCSPSETSSQPRRRHPVQTHTPPKPAYTTPSPDGGYTSMDDGYSSQGGYSSHGGFYSSPDESKYSNSHAGYSSGNGPNGGRRRTTPPSSPRTKTRSYGDRRHARQYLKNTQRIHTTYTPFSLIGHIGLIVYRIIMLLGTPSPFQLVSFTHLVYLTDTAFHIFSLAWHLLRFPKLERITVIYGTWVVWIGWGLAIWLSDPDMEIHQLEHRATFGIGYDVRTGGSGGPRPMWHQPHHRTYGSNDSIDINQLLPLAPFVKKYSSWRMLYMPLMTFLGLLMFRRNLWGLISWEHLTRMEQIGQLKYYRAWCLSGVGAGWAVAWRFCRWWFHVPYMPMDDPAFCRYASSGKSCMDLLEAAAAAQRSSSYAFPHGAPTVVRYRTDVIEFGFWPMILSNLVMGLILMCWWSFWTFQYQGVVWREDLKEGWAVWKTTTGGVMTGLVTDEELRKSVKDWTGHHRSDREHHHHQQQQHSSNRGGAAATNGNGTAAP